MKFDVAELGELVRNQLWQVTIVALLVGLTVRFGCRRRPHLAYLLWVLVVIKCVIPPLWSSPTGMFSWTNVRAAADVPRLARERTTALSSPTKPGPVLDRARTQSVPSVRNETSRSEAASPVEASPVKSDPKSSMPELDSKTSASRISRTTAAGFIWICGVLVCVVVILWKRIVCSALIRRSTVAPNDALVSLIADLSHRLGVRKSVRLVLISKPLGPGVFGVLRPTLVLPDLLLLEKSAAELEPILAHELIHIRRGDTAVGLLQLFVQALWWFHPLIWWANRETCRERERCCDEAVVASLNCPPASYAQSLLDVLKLKRRLRPVLGFPGVRPVEVTLTRLENIMKRSEKFKSHTPRWCWAVMIATGALILPGQGLVIGSKVAQANQAALQKQKLESEKPKEATDQQPAAASGNANVPDNVPVVERSTFYIEAVQRGTMVRQVRGLGTLVPEQTLIIHASTVGRVERIVALPGAEVKADTVLIKLSNPELEQSLTDAEWQIKAAEAQLTRLQTQSEGEQLQQQAATATLKSDLAQALIAVENDAKASANGVISSSVAKSSNAKAEELTTRYEIEQQRLTLNRESARAQLAQQQAELQRLRSLLDLKRRQVSGLEVRAGIDGVVQQVGGSERLQAGQTVTPSTMLAKIVQPNRLRAELTVAESQATEIDIGQLVSIDTRKGVVAGRVAGMDPTVTVQTGTVTVYVALEGQLPKGIRPGSRVDGSIEIEKLTDILYVSRPVQGQENSQVKLFKIIDGGNAALRVPVKFGRSSVSTIEVLEGLQAGDKIVVSDTSNLGLEEFDRIRLR
jgi:HlyD family secretion protein